MKTEARLEELQTDVSILQRKLSALSSLVYDRLESAETNAEAKWVERTPVAKKLYEETAEDLYLIATVISDISKSVDTIIEEKA
ncbi:hypothetical protein ERX37_07680 [Macrococcus hajekii]|uniref:Uncharacterized protein n=1 Tax=Macrococcus hajekii TaxID=198482 RepID=A0A4R6BK27_9STAP|nr:hypothetical protein [Macrococcus hajekii]TDM02073.1 hypothetical protein ERX37_07680 [Macrococcus hajekii]GGB09837.1 hypothetical protein GCM10007190_17410 [Macrococcus hajekii]